MRLENTSMGECGQESLVCEPEEETDVSAAASFNSSFKRLRSREVSSECTEFDCSRTEVLKHGRGQGENAISNTSEFEIELQNSDVSKRTISRAKRTKCVCLLENAYNSVDSPCNPKSSDISLFPSAVDKGSLKTAIPASYKSTGCGTSSASHSEDTNSDGESKPSDDPKQKTLKLKQYTMEQRYIQDHNIWNGDKTAKEKPGEFLDFDAIEHPKSIDNRQKAICCYSDPSPSDQQIAREATLVDVHLTVEGSNQADDDVPLVCLTSKITGKPILGYPLEIGVLHNPSETTLLTKENFPSSGDGSSTFHRLVWKKSRRTPVCYVTNSLQDMKASKTVQDPVTMLKKIGANRGQGVGATCVPVELVFRKVLEAVGQV